MTTQPPSSNATTTPDAPADWLHLQQAIASYLRAPLRLVAAPALPTFAAPSEGARRASGVDDNAARHVLLHQQLQWQDRLQRMQRLFVRTAGVLGAFSFNRLMLAYLTSSGQGELLDDNATAAAVSAHLRGLVTATSTGGDSDDRPVHQLGDVLLAPAPPRSALVQALARDDAERRAATAPWLSPVVDGPRRLRPGARRIITSPSVSVLRSTWRWPGAPTVSKGQPVRLTRGEAIHEVVARSASGVSVTTVDALTACVLQLAQRQPWPEVVAVVAAGASEQDRALLPAQLVGIATQALTQGWWLGPSASP